MGPETKTSLNFSVNNFLLKFYHTCHSKVDRQNCSTSHVPAWQWVDERCVCRRNNFYRTTVILLKMGNCERVSFPILYSFSVGINTQIVDYKWHAKYTHAFVSFNGIQISVFRWWKRTKELCIDVFPFDSQDVEFLWI